MTEKDIARINELYRLSKQGLLTSEQKKEQQELRQAYIDSIKANIKSQLESIKVVSPDNTVIDIKKRHDEKYGTN